MNPAKILIVDDESLARSRLRSILEEIQSDQIIIEAANGKQALDIIQSEMPNIVLLDIRMPVMDGIETAKHIANLEHSPSVIFTTAYSDYALDAFDAHAIDYLLKPIRKDRLKLALQKAAVINKPNLDLLHEDLQKSRTHISAFVQGNLKLISIEQIKYFKADKKYVSIFFEQQEVLIGESLKSLEEEFATNFIRVHRNTLVAKNAIEGLEKDQNGGWNVKLIDITETLPVSRRLQSLVRKYIRTGEFENI